VSSTKESAQAIAEVTLQPNVNYHIACVYNSREICVYVNHTLASVRINSSSFCDHEPTQANITSFPGLQRVGRTDLFR
jgi:hypothetical protein